MFNRSNQQQLKLAIILASLYISIFLIALDRTMSV